MNLAAPANCWIPDFLGTPVLTLYWSFDGHDLWNTGLQDRHWRGAAMISSHCVMAFQLVQQKLQDLAIDVQRITLMSPR